MFVHSAVIGSRPARDLEKKSCSVVRTNGFRQRGETVEAVPREGLAKRYQMRTRGI